ncbi:MAG: class I SAM-dependent methyltransferase [Rubrivivax sp.]|nr:class I SAM-dependent methyltransferase [Rubrivivax sp.]
MPRADHIGLLHRGNRVVTRWGNLGLWRTRPPAAGPGSGSRAAAPGTKDAQPGYPEACAALARAVGMAAGVTPGDTVLCLACGGGEELALWAEEFGAGSVMALELSPSLAAQARARAEANHTGCRIDVHCADAGRLAEQVGGRFHRIVCVDAIYHLGPRAPLVRAAQQRLFGGGGLAWSDLVLEPPAALAAGTRWRRAVLWAGARLAGIHYAELRGTAATLALWQDAGLADVRAVRLDDDVLGGFRAHAARQARRLRWRERLSLAWWRVVMTAALIRIGRPAGLGYALFSGRVRSADASAETGLVNAAGAAADPAAGAATGEESSVRETA